MEFGSSIGTFTICDLDPAFSTTGFGNALSCFPFLLPLWAVFFFSLFLASAFGVSFFASFFTTATGAFWGAAATVVFDAFVTF